LCAGEHTTAEGDAVGKLPALGESAGSSHQTFTLTVDSQPAITSPEATTFTYKQPGSFTVTATGAPIPTITETGTLPSGVTFREGVLSGTPAKVGIYRLAFTATNGVGSDAVQSNFTLTVER
jgi:hypothetical protein